MDERDVDAEFEAIIAGWEQDSAADDESRTDEATDPAGRPTPEGPAEDGVRAPGAGPLPGLGSVLGDGWRVNPPLPGFGTDAPPAPVVPDPDEPEEHFVPEPVVLPPQEDLHFWGTVIGLVAGPLLLLWVVFVGKGTQSSWWLFFAVALTIGGFALLVLRQPAHRDPDDDDGARL